METSNSATNIIKTNTPFFDIVETLRKNWKKTKYRPKKRTTILEPNHKHMERSKSAKNKRKQPHHFLLFDIVETLCKNGKRTKYRPKKRTTILKQYHKTTTSRWKQATVPQTYGNNCVIFRQFIFRHCRNLVQKWKKDKVQAREKDDNTGGIPQEDGTKQECQKQKETTTPLFDIVETLRKNWKKTKYRPKKRTSKSARNKRKQLRRHCRNRAQNLKKEKV